jgi:putative flippase GtrA
VSGELAQVGRFLLLGAVNSLTSIGLYALFQQAMPIPVAYAIAYLCGIALSALLSGRLVFRVTSTRKTRALAFSGYLAVFLTGLALVWLLQEGADLAPLVAGFGSVIVTAPLNYLVGRTVFTAPPVVRRQH